jgi:hypothetical protein
MTEMQPTRRYGDYLMPADAARLDLRRDSRSRPPGRPAPAFTGTTRDPCATTSTSGTDLSATRASQTSDADGYPRSSRAPVTPPVPAAPFIIPTRRKVRDSPLTVHAPPLGPPPENAAGPLASSRPRPPPPPSPPPPSPPRPGRFEPTQEAFHDDLTEALPAAPEPRALDACLRALERFRDLLRAPGPYRYKRAQEVTATLRNLGFVGLDDEMRDVVLMHFSPDSKKLDQVGLRQKHAFLADAQVAGLTAMLARRRAHDQAGTPDTQALTMDVYQALNRRMPID